ncbi:hypothetical protein ACFSEO_00380 [Agromyces cerinus subsp. nitratus]|uniref:hypothetical protein n=1 Tax=Agromyces cerinus TaxID=33878 RepID=UPI0036302D5F
MSTGTAGGSATLGAHRLRRRPGAVDFANWMSTDDGALEILIRGRGILPGRDQRNRPRLAQ